MKEESKDKERQSDILNEKRQRGRPKGSRSAKRDVVELQPSHCKRCGSTERLPYKQNPVIRKITGVRNGIAYNTVIWRHTACTVCKQARVDICYENRQN